MQLTAVLLRWYRSFNVAGLGPADPLPRERWNFFLNAPFPFVSVPIDRSITTVVGANESGKSHLLSAIAKVINGEGMPGRTKDRYEIKDICRYCGFGALDDVWPEIGLELNVTVTEATMFEPEGAASPVTSSTDHADNILLTVILNGRNPDKYATVYRSNTALRTFSASEWRAVAVNDLPSVAILDADLALPNDIHIDELIDLYHNEKPRAVIDPLGMQDLWREIEPISIVQGAIDGGTAQRVQNLKDTISKTTRRFKKRECELASLLFSGILRVGIEDLKRIRLYTNSERGYVSWINDEINARIDRELDISQYWDQDEDFKLSVNYKAGTFHFQITDRTGSTYTFNERSSGLRYFLSYYIQAKAVEKSEASRGMVILMDEPDSYLSASGQRSLLRVFDSLVSRKQSNGVCQLIYTTHSPFLINRNFPQRIRLVRKGDGSEGTQYVPRSAVRRFEPVRSALSIDAADTLFLGSTNVVVEGHEDQKLLTACIQRFSAPGKLDEVLDLNSVTLVAAGGAPYASELVRKAIKGDEKPPIVVALLDGDGPGTHFAGEVAKIISDKQVCTLREVEVPGRVFEVMEDIVPIPLLDRAIQTFVSGLGFTVAATFDGSTAGRNHAERITLFCKSSVKELASYQDVEIRAGIVDALVDLLGDDGFFMAQLDELRANAESVCKRINEMIEYAVRNSRQQSLKRSIRQQIETFGKRFPLAASKGDVRRVLHDLKHSAVGYSEDFERTRKNIDLLLERLGAEAQQNSDPIDIGNWRIRLERFKNAPWAVIQDWAKVVAAPIPQQPRTESVEHESASGESAH